MAFQAVVEYEFFFVGDYDDALYSQSPYGDDTTLKGVIINAVNKEKDFLVRFPKVNRIAQQITYNNKYFKVVLDR
jgi:hypothetical protein